MDVLLSDHLAAMPFLTVSFRLRHKRVLRTLFDIHESGNATDLNFLRRDRAADLAALVKLEMERAMPLQVPTPVKLSVGLNWGSLESVTLEKLRAEWSVVPGGNEMRTLG
eukprot:1157271-Pelagomonas_calceolata.AAC.23